MNEGEEKWGDRLNCSSLGQQEMVAPLLWTGKSTEVVHHSLETDVASDGTVAPEGVAPVYCPELCERNQRTVRVRKGFVCK